MKFWNSPETTVDKSVRRQSKAELHCWIYCLHQIGPNGSFTASREQVITQWNMKLWTQRFKSERASWYKLIRSGREKASPNDPRSGFTSAVRMQKSGSSFQSAKLSKGNHHIFSWTQFTYWYKATVKTLTTNSLGLSSVCLVWTCKVTGSSTAPTILQTFFIFYK